jgi:import inner membrane translocase subunit TIM54
MSTPHANEGTPSTNLPPPSPKPSGPIKRILTSTGIPPSWLDKRPRLPSRNWLIFLSGVSSVLGLYYYDRRECKRIRREFVDRVKHLSERSADTMEWPRKVTVYGCKWPGDEDYGRSLKYFRKYVKVRKSSVEPPFPWFLFVVVC